MYIRFLALLVVAAFFVGCENTDSNEAPFFVGYTDGQNNIQIGSTILDDDGLTAGQLTEENTVEVTIEVFDDGLGEVNDNLAEVDLTAEIVSFTVSSGAVDATATLTGEEAETIAGIGTGSDAVGVKRTLKLEVTVKGSVGSGFDGANGETLRITIGLSDGGKPVTKTFIITAYMASEVST